MTKIMESYYPQQLKDTLFASYRGGICLPIREEITP